MFNRLVLAGGDEFRDGCEDMDISILKATGKKNPKVFIVPTGAGETNAVKSAMDGVRYFSKLGAVASPLMVVDTDTANNPENSAIIKRADIVYFTGGDPSFLLRTLRDSTFLDGLRVALHHRAIIAGSSAGAMVMCEWMKYGGWTKALNLIPGIAVLPHHERNDPETTNSQLQKSSPNGIRVLGVDAKSCCFIDGGRWSVRGLGSVTLYMKSGWNQYYKGQDFSENTSSV